MGGSWLGTHYVEWRGAFLILSQQSSALSTNILERAFSCGPEVLIMLSSGPQGARVSKEE